MNDVIRVQVPTALADELPDDEFATFGALRGGGGAEAEAVLAVISTSVGIAANTTIILMARDAISDFIRHLRSWIARHAGTDSGSELVIEISAHSPNGDSRLRLEFKSDGGSVPGVDVDAVARMLHSAFLTHRSKP